MGSRLATFELKRTMLSLRLSLVLMVLGLAASVQSDETTSTPVMMENSDSPGDGGSDSDNQGVTDAGSDGTTTVKTETTTGSSAPVLVMSNMLVSTMMMIFIILVVIF